MNTVPELPDELHELIAQYNRRYSPVFTIQWVKQGSIFQIVVHPSTCLNKPANFECITKTLEERIKTTQSLSKCLPFSINRMNDLAKNWQIRLAMNDDTRRIAPNVFSDIAKDITESLAKTCNTIVNDITESFMMGINTQVVKFDVTGGLQGEVPCKAYRQPQISYSSYS